MGLTKFPLVLIGVQDLRSSEARITARPGTVLYWNLTTPGEGELNAVILTGGNGIVESVKVKFPSAPPSICSWYVVPATPQNVNGPAEV